MLINKSDLPDTEYVAVYTSRSDGDWELYMVLSRSAIEDEPEEVVVPDDEYKIIPSDSLDFPDIWSDNNEYTT